MPETMKPVEPYMPTALVSDDMLLDTGSEIITWGELRKRSKFATRPETAPDVGALIADIEREMHGLKRGYADRRGELLFRALSALSAASPTPKDS